MSPEEFDRITVRWCRAENQLRKLVNRQNKGLPSDPKWLKAAQEEFDNAAAVRRYARENLG